MLDYGYTRDDPSFGHRRPATLWQALAVFALALTLSPRQFTGQGTEAKFLLFLRAPQQETTVLLHK